MASLSGFLKSHLELELRLPLPAYTDGVAAMVNRGDCVCAFHEHALTACRAVSNSIIESIWAPAAGSQRYSSSETLASACTRPTCFRESNAHHAIVRTRLGMRWVNWQRLYSQPQLTALNFFKNAGMGSWMELSRLIALSSLSLSQA